MESLLEEHEKLCRKGNLSKSLDDVQKTIHLLVKARNSIASRMFVPQVAAIEACRTEPITNLHSIQTKLALQLLLPSSKIPSSSRSRP